jgi:signal transduction histidine kinase
MNRDVVVSTLLYLLSVAVLLSGFYIFLEGRGFTREAFLWGSAIFLVMSIFFGYILTLYSLSHKWQVDEHLLHLTKEILHELNIPISTIQANTSLLRRTLKESEKSLVRLERIDASTYRLERLYMELVYSIKKEIAIIEREELLLESLIVEQVETMRLQARNPFSLELESLRVKVDKIGFEKSLDNILLNAMKYSSKNSPIEILLKGSILTITDHGIGMDEHELINIYERYYQFDKRVSGEGIGLALVKAYCDDEKIKIRIRSKKGEGTKVSLDLSYIML